MPDGYGELNYETNGVIDVIINDERLWKRSEEIKKRCLLTQRQMELKGIYSVAPIYDVKRLRRMLISFISANGVIATSGVWKDNPPPGRGKIDYMQMALYFAQPD